MTLSTMSRCARRAVLLLATATACARAEDRTDMPRTATALKTSPAPTGRLSARPQPVATPGPFGLRTLPSANRRPTLLFVPEAANDGAPRPLVVMLHGAGGDARHALELMKKGAEREHALVLAPASHDATWDVVASDYGPDVAALDAALAQVFSEYRVDPARIAIAGFSDGASYALSLGLTNGDLFTDVLAFSPGFAAPASHVGHPRIYVSHGVDDRVLPIDRCSRRVVPALRHAGYEVFFREFDGPHTVPSSASDEAWRQFVGRAS